MSITIPLARVTPIILALDFIRTIAETKKYTATIDPTAFLAVLLKLSSIT
ncbi:MAG: hypothetical protein NWF07_01905 [Candidatus Bathyarchaeota archaeon]|nr:hypothetical protein [Candidatus Bathyarchaeota archaeon]